MHLILRIVWSALVVCLGVALPSWVSAGNWPAYLYGPTHSSVNNQATAITPVTATALVPAWNWRPDSPTKPGQPPVSLHASPTVYNGRIYIGAQTGEFYALDEATGAVVWQRFLGFTPKLTCQNEASHGFVGTATVGVDPSTSVPTVYVYSQDGNLYALDAGNGAIVWSSRVYTPSSSVNDYSAWSSPTVSNGKIYVGISSNCDRPLVPGGVMAFEQATGNPIGTYSTMPPGAVGGSVWTSAAVASTSGNVLVTTGNVSRSSTQPGDSYSIVRLDGQTLAKLDIWTVPAGELVRDSDFGGSPTIFEANLQGTLTPMVGACNKNGSFYALRIDNLAAGPVWTFHVGIPGVKQGFQCLAAAIWDGSHLFVASNKTTIRGVNVPGSIRELDPATGTIIWETGLSGQVLGSPTKNGAGVIAVATYGKAAYLIDASSGQILKTISAPTTFSQPVFADSYLFVAPTTGDFTAYTIGP
jgi:polyvinyl alcohol dehydrogenase (cytochrome)